MEEQEFYSQRLESFISQGEHSTYFEPLSSDVFDLCQRLTVTDDKKISDHNLSRLWLPLSIDLATARQPLNRTFIQGILGGQGTGKSTLCKILKFILDGFGFSVASLSIDDLYLTYDKRQKLQQKDPRFVWRGPPGTHEIDLGLRVIEQCLEGDEDAEILMPRFDKSLQNGQGDRTEPEAMARPDILLFEGWFVGVEPVDESCFEHPPEPIITPEDRQFALDNNQGLQAYLPLWEKLDRLIVLYPEDYRLSKEWRRKAEHTMIATEKTEKTEKPGKTEETEKKGGMSDPEIDRFVEYFWKALHPELFIEPLTRTADMVVEIRRDHSLGEIRRNS